MTRGRRWQDDQGGAIYGHASDLQAVLAKQHEAQLQAQIADNPGLMSGAIEGCNG